ncbi:hypothetical protein [Luteococcus sp.]|uniref:hypothetical protein n=1 Tax=Luteococcus sp. TaxID=1969402 RepID=UPI0037357125
MSTATCTVADLAAPATAYLDDGTHPDGLMLIVLIDEQGPRGAISVPVANVRDSGVRAMFAARDLIDEPVTQMIGFVYGESRPVAQNMCALWLDLFGELTKTPVHGLVVVTDGTATCRCGCSTAEYAGPGN